MNTMCRFCLVQLPIGSIESHEAWHWVNDLHTAMCQASVAKALHREADVVVPSKCTCGLSLLGLEPEPEPVAEPRKVLLGSQVCLHCLRPFEDCHCDDILVEDDDYICGVCGDLSCDYEHADD